MKHADEVFDPELKSLLIKTDHFFNVLKLRSGS
jgi:hypothetical protein